MVAITSLFIFASSVSAAAIGTPVEKRQASALQPDLTAINSLVIALDNSINSWDGTTNGVGPIAQAEGNLDSKIKSATTDAQNAGKVSVSQGASVESYINSPLIPNIKKALTDLDNNHARFESIGFTGVVEDDLETLKTDTDNYANALIADAANSAQVTTGQNEKSQLDSLLQTAINTFSS